MSQLCIIRLGADTIYEGLPCTTTTGFSSTWYDKILIDVGDRLREQACVPNQPFFTITNFYFGVNGWLHMHVDHPVLPGYVINRLPVVSCTTGFSFLRCFVTGQLAQ